MIEAVSRLLGAIHLNLLKVSRNAVSFSPILRDPVNGDGFNGNAGSTHQFRRLMIAAVNPGRNGFAGIMVADSKNACFSKGEFEFEVQRASE